MNQRLFSVLIFAFVVSAGASLLLYRLIASRVTANAKQPTTQVIVAARTMELGTLIRDSDLKLGDWPGMLPKGSVLRKEDVVGRGVMAAIYEGEPVLENRLAPKGAGAGLAATIPAGMRAVGAQCPRPCCRILRFSRPDKISRKTPRASRCRWRLSTCWSRRSKRKS